MECLRSGVFSLDRDFEKLSRADWSNVVNDGVELCSCDLKDGSLLY